MRRSIWQHMPGGESLRHPPPCAISCIAIALSTFIVAPAGTENEYNEIVAIISILMSASSMIYDRENRAYGNGRINCTIVYSQNLLFTAAYSDISPNGMLCICRCRASEECFNCEPQLAGWLSDQRRVARWPEGLQEAQPCRIEHLPLRVCQDVEAWCATHSCANRSPIRLQRLSMRPKAPPLPELQELKSRSHSDRRRSSTMRSARKHHQHHQLRLVRDGSSAWAGSRYRPWQTYRRLLAPILVIVALAALVAHEIVTSPWPPLVTIRHILAKPNCDAARSVGLAPSRRGRPGYYVEHDRDRDGVACEPYPSTPPLP